MPDPLRFVDIFLHPGDLYFGDRDTRIRTVLGSCVSLTFWHPKLLIGGMCHYMLPNRLRERRAASAPSLDGRYADEAIEIMTKEIDAVGVPYCEYQVKLFGGGNMFSGHGNMESHVGRKNIEAARGLVSRHGFNCVAEHIGGPGHRKVIFDVWSGGAWVKHGHLAHPDDNRHGADNQTNDRRMPCAVFA